jgi:glycosyltransferase 2 family protein
MRTVAAKPMARFERTAERTRSARADRRNPVGGQASKSHSTMSRTVWAWARPVAVAATLTVVVWQVGFGPFLDGVRAVDGAALAAGAVIGLLTTVCCAWRWTIVARGLGLPLSFSAAVAAYYRSVFLNLTLPGGVAGDVHRGVSHGRDVRDVGLALRAVAWERTAGQVVGAIVTVVVLVALPSPVRPSIPLVVVALVAVAIAVVLVGRARPGAGRSRWRRVRRAIAGDVRDALLARGAWPAIVLTSALVVIGHATAFVIAARTAGATAPLSQLFPLALLAMLAMVLPSVAGWGPREGATAWAFAAAGLGAGLGVATAVVYGAMVLVASLPGALVLVAAWVPRAAAIAQTDGAADA